MQQNVPSQGRTETPQKTSDYLGNLRVDETNMDGAPEVILERIPCIWKVKAIHPTFAKELGLQVRPIAFWDAFQYRSTENRRHHAGYL